MNSINSIIGVYDCVEDKTMGLPKKPVAQPKLNDQNYKLWVKAYPLECSPALTELKGKITHVSYEVFCNSLNQTVQKFKDATAGIKKFHYVALVQPDKSQKWVTEIALTQSLKPFAFLCLGEEGANNLEYALKDIYPKDQRYRHFVIVDDGSFSGNQMANNISAANRIINTKFAVNPIFHILIPYMTKTAQEKMNSLKGIDIKLYTSVTMPLVSECVSQKNLGKVLQSLWPSLTEEERKKRSNSIALYWFDHKIPNSMSFPQTLAEGIVPQPKGSVQVENIRFLPNVQPPYKSV